MCHKMPGCIFGMASCGSGGRIPKTCQDLRETLCASRWSADKVQVHCCLVMDKQASMMSSHACCGFPTGTQCYASAISVMSTLQHRSVLRDSVSEVHNSTAMFFTGFLTCCLHGFRSSLMSFLCCISALVT